MFTDVAFFETTLLSLSSIVTSPREDDDLLVYYVSLPVPTLVPILVKPPITQVYFRRQIPQVLSPTPAALTLDPVSNKYLPTTYRIGKCQYVHPTSLFCSYNHLSSHSCSFIASLDFILLPNNVHEALFHSGWHSAMIEEMHALNDNGTC